MTSHYKKEAISALEAEFCDEWSELRNLSSMEEMEDAIRVMEDLWKDNFGFSMPLPDEEPENLSHVVRDYVAACLKELDESVELDDI